MKTQNLFILGIGRLFCLGRHIGDLSRLTCRFATKKKGFGGVDVRDPKYKNWKSSESVVILALAVVIKIDAMSKVRRRKHEPGASNRDGKFPFAARFTSYSTSSLHVHTTRQLT